MPSETVLQQLATQLNKMRTERETTATMNPGNELAAQRKKEAMTYLQALDDVARKMGLTVKTEYTL